MTEYDLIDAKPVVKRIYHTQRHCYVDVFAVDIGRPQRGKPDPNRAVRATSEDRALFNPVRSRRAKKTAGILERIDNFLRTQPDNEAWLGDIAEHIGLTPRGLRHHIRSNPDRYTEENRMYGTTRRLIISFAE